MSVPHRFNTGNPDAVFMDSVISAMRCKRCGQQVMHTGPRQTLNLVHVTEPDDKHLVSIMITQDPPRIGGK